MRNSVNIVGLLEVLFSRGVSPYHFGWSIVYWKTLFLLARLEIPERFLELLFLNIHLYANAALRSTFHCIFCPVQPSSRCSEQCKGTVSQDFWVLFFHQMAPPCPIRITLRRFRFFPNIRGDILQKVGSVVYHTPRNGDSTVYHTDSCMIHTPQNVDSVVHLTPRSLC